MWSIFGLFGFLYLEFNLYSFAFWKHLTIDPRKMFKISGTTQRKSSRESLVGLSSCTLSIETSYHCWEYVEITADSHLNVYKISLLKYKLWLFKFYWGCIFFWWKIFFGGKLKNYPLYPSSYQGRGSVPASDMKMISAIFFHTRIKTRTAQNQLARSNWLLSNLSPQK